MAPWRAGWFLGWPEKVQDQPGASCYARKGGNAQRMIRHVTRTQNNKWRGVGENREMTRKENNGRQDSSRSRMPGAYCEQGGCCWPWKIIIVPQPPRSNLVQAVTTKRCYTTRTRFDPRQDAYMAAYCLPTHCSPGTTAEIWQRPDQVDGVLPGDKAAERKPARILSTSTCQTIHIF